MPVAYLRIVCAKIAGTGKFSVQEIFSFTGKKCCGEEESLGSVGRPSTNYRLAHSWSKVETLNYGTDLPQHLTRETDVKRVQTHPPFHGNRPGRQQEGHLWDQQDQRRRSQPRNSRRKGRQDQPRRPDRRSLRSRDVEVRGCYTRPSQARHPLKDGKQKEGYRDGTRHASRGTRSGSEDKV